MNSVALFGCETGRDDEIARGIQHLAALSWLPGCPKPTWFAVLIAYMDESGTHDPTGVQRGSATPTIAGYLAPYKMWTSFQRKWLKVLRRYEMWGRFHMKEYIAERGEFEGWSAAKRLSFMKALCDTIRSHELIGLGGTVDVKDYDLILPQWAKDEIRHPYYFCFAAMMKSLAQWNPDLDLSNNRINFVFDRKEGFQGFTEEMFYRLKKSSPIHARLLGDISFRSSDALMPLQAADLLAYETRLYASESQVVGTPARRASMRSLLDNTTVIVGRADADYFRSHLEARKRQLGL
jgi:hypothetical protein